MPGVWCWGWVYGGIGGMEESGAGGAWCMVVLVGWRGLVLGVQYVRWSWWDGGVWCRVCGGLVGMTGSGAGGYGAGGTGCMVVLVGWRGLVLGVQGVWWSWWDGGVWCWGCRV